MTAYQDKECQDRFTIEKNKVYCGILSYTPIKPYSIQVRLSNYIIGVDDGEGGIVDVRYTNGFKIDYLTGQFSLELQDSPNNCIIDALIFKYKYFAEEPENFVLSGKTDYELSVYCTFCGAPKFKNTKCKYCGN